jgi:hypothetical protein
MLKYCPKCKKNYPKNKRKCDFCKIKLTKPKRYIKINWKELCKGQTIRIQPGSGPVYYLPKGRSINMGHIGEFLVEKTNKNGIYAYGKHGFAFIYMGPVRKSNTGTLLQPHKIMLKNVNSNNGHNNKRVDMV